jgi:4-amino-4-deoxy-L-arabinose transferase-like glycosyltransferase
MKPSFSIGRREWLAVSALTLIGAILRFWDVGRLGILHFDEGIYALSGLWIRSSKGLASLDPSVAFYAPPVFPTLVGMMYLILGTSDTSAVLVSLLTGVATIPFAAWVAGRSFGRGAAVAAAALLAFCGPHVAFSRMALTDATFLLIFLLALGLGSRFLERPCLVRAMLLGLVVGLAQLTKYNGFLAGLSVAFVPLLWLIDRDPTRRRLACRALGLGLLAAAIAALCYWPWFQFVQARVPGGYPGLIRHHRGYLSPPSQWPRNAFVQWAEAITLAGRLSGWIGWGSIGWALGWIAAAWASERIGWIVRSSDRMAMRARLALPAGVLVLGALPDAPWWLTLVSLPWLWRSHSVGCQLLGAAWVVQSLLLPMYHPYARLALPLVVLGHLAAAGWLARIVDADEADETFPKVGGFPAWAGLVAVLLLALGMRLGVAWPAPAGGLLAPSDGLRWLGTLARNGSLPERVYLLGRPSLLFYLTSGRPVDVVRLADARDLPSGRLAEAAKRAPKAKAWVIVDGAVASMAVNETLMVPGSLEGEESERWDNGNLAIWLDLDPEMALTLGRRQIFNEARGNEPFGQNPSDEQYYTNHILRYDF